MFAFRKVDSLIFFISIELIISFSSFAQFEKQRDSIKVLQRILDSASSDSARFDTYMHIAYQYYLMEEYDSTINYTNRAQAMEYDENPKNLVWSYSLEGICLDLYGDYTGALSNYLDALRICDVYKQSPLKVYNNLGNVYIKLSNWDQAENYLLKALEICNEENILQGQLYINGNLGIVYKNKGDLDMAMKMYESSLNASEKLRDSVAICRNYINIGALLESMDRVSEGLEYYLKCKAMAEKINRLSGMISANVKAGIAEKKLGHYSESFKYLEEGIKMAEQNKDLRYLEEAHLNMSELNEILKSYELAVFHRKKYEFYKDSLQNSEHLNEIKKLEYIYAVEKKDKELAESNMRIHLQENELLKKNAQVNLALSGGGVLMLLSFGLWIMYRQRKRLHDQKIDNLAKQKEIATLEALINGEEKERTRIARDLHDGLNGDLAVIKYKMSALDLVGMKSSDQMEFHSALDLLDTACDNIRNISHHLAPGSLANFNLIEGVGQYCKKMDQLEKTKIEFQSFGDNTSLTLESEIMIYRMIQEMISNILKHAKADEALIQMNFHDDHLNITVEDNGIGFDTESVQTGLGMQNIQSRVSYLNGELDIHSDSKGTTFEINIYYDRIKHEN